ncbi:MAG: hypothetical protein HQK62_12605, partial [Desulfamplus sp.]|nr:hypothetical protein [Desulfamplus sp.]
NNAFKFTEKGGIIVRVYVGEKGCDTTQKDKSEPHDLKHAEQLQVSDSILWLNFEVEDTGIGIHPDETTKIFAPFEQTEAGRLTKDGTGLGLSISKNFVELMGGRITLKSKPGAGSLFRFSIAVKEVQTLATKEVDNKSGLVHSIDKVVSAAKFMDGIQVSSDAASVVTDRFLALPETFRTDLENALLRGDMKAIEFLILQIGDNDPDLAAGLRTLSHNFEYEKILAIIHQAVYK